MQAVAHNSAFAKKVGIPQSVGKEFMKADKRKVKKYGIGGPTSYSGEDDSDKGMKMSTRRGGGDDGMSFKEAFRAARKAGVDKFEWQGKKYTTEMAGERKAAPAASSRQASAADLPGMRETQAPKLTRDIQKLDLSREPKPAPAAAPAASRYAGPKFGEGVDQLKRLGERLSKSGEMMRERKLDMTKGQPQAFEGARQLSDFLKRDIEEKEARNRRISMTTPEGMRRGGKVVKKYASGGSVGASASKRADGIAARGKTRCKIV